MYKVDIAQKKLVELTTTNLSSLGIKERFDVQEWIEKSPRILGEDLLIIAKELILPSGKRLDLLAIDRAANLVVIELKRDDSGNDIEIQAIKYVSYVSNFTADELLMCFASTLESDTAEAALHIEEFVDDMGMLNQSQRIILVAREFQPEVVSAVLWLRDYQVDIKCVRLRTYVDHDGELFITPDIIIPLPEAKDYVQRKEVKQRDTRTPHATSFSTEIGTYELPELEERLRNTLSFQSPLIPRLVALIEILLASDRVFSRTEILSALFERGVGKDLGQTGRYMSNLSQLLTKKGSSHLRQCIDFESDGGIGTPKDNFAIRAQFRPLLRLLVDEWYAHQTRATETPEN